MSNSEDDSDDLERLLAEARRRLMRFEIERHRSRAEVARLEAVVEARKAAELARLLDENPDDLAFATALAAYHDLPGRGLAWLRRGVGIDGDDTESGAGGGNEVPPAHKHRAANVVRPRTDAPHDAPRRPFTASLLTPVHKPASPSGPGTPHSVSETPVPDRKRTKPHARPPGMASSRCAAPRTAQPFRKARRFSPAWVTSVVVHLVALVVLGFITIAVAMREPEPVLAATIGLPRESAVAELPDVEIAPPEESELEVTEPQAFEAPLPELQPDSPLLLAEHAQSLPWAAAGAFAFAELPLGNAALLEAGGPQHGDGNGERATDGYDLTLPAASFFGAEARANRIVFLVDNSNSMDEGRFETALTELARTVDAFAPKQSFYVILYSDTVYPLFHPQAADALVPATPENKRRLRAWLGTVEMCVGGRLVDAFKLAAELEPQAVYLLSDGVISDYPVSYLTERRDWEFTVHTIGMTVPDRTAAEKLIAIAEANGGVFRPVGVTPLAREMARRRPVKKNRTRGAVWGLKLPPRL